MGENACAIRIEGIGSQLPAAPQAESPPTSFRNRRRDLAGQRSIVAVGLSPAAADRHRFLAAQGALAGEAELTDTPMYPCTISRPCFMSAITAGRERRGNCKPNPIRLLLCGRITGGC